MTLLLVFAVTLLLAVLISDMAERSVLSTAILFLAAGVVSGSGALWASPSISPHLLERLSEIALFGILFTDGMRTGGIRGIVESWRLPGRSLFIGMPLTIAGIAVLAHYLLGISWLQALLIGSVLSPTDPVFVSALFRFENVPERLKHLLNVESGLNDGLALPLILLLLNHASGLGEQAWQIVVELVGGIAVGIIVPWLGMTLEQSRFFSAARLYQPLNAFAIGLLVMAICYRTNANLFLGAYAAGLSVATFGSDVAESFQRFGDLLTELFKLLALLVFGNAIAPELFSRLSVGACIFVALAVFAVRPLALGIALIKSVLPWRERIAVGWFGPKGFASVVYGLMILQAGLNGLAHLVALAVIVSIVVFSSTDILVGRWLEAHSREQAPAADRQR